MKQGVFCLLNFLIQIELSLNIEEKYDVVKVTTKPNYGKEIVTMETRSKLNCATKCSEVADCKSVVYVSTSKTCTLNDEITDVTSILCNSTSQCSTFYAGKRVIPTMNVSCQSNAECSEDNSECRGNLCVCSPGYSYNANKFACVSSCNIYGTTFQEDVGSLLQNGAANSATSVYSLTLLALCKDLCINELRFTCKTFEYDFSESNCYLQSYTLFDHPTSYRADSNYTFYTRDCA